MTTENQAEPSVQTQFEELISAMQNRQDNIKMYRTAQEIAKKQLARLLKRYPDQARTFAQDLKDLGVKEESEPTVTTTP
jgi:hypothetical protein